MSNDLKTTRVNLDGRYSLDITVNENAKTVVAELIVGEEATFIYAEKFDAPCNYIRTAIKKGIVYIGAEKQYFEHEKAEVQENNVFA